MKTNGILSISEVNALSLEQFEWLFGNVIEQCPEAARHVGKDKAQRPFASAAALKKAFEDYLDKLDSQEKESVLNRHPDLASKLVEGSLTADSQYEQKCAGLENMSREEQQLMETYNELYKTKFRFPFVICARENKVQTILAAIQTRLHNAREAEVQLGIQEVKKICNIRINDLVWPSV